MSTSYKKFQTWGKHEISGFEAVDLARRIWRIGEEEGYWSECVLRISPTFDF